VTFKVSPRARDYLTVGFVLIKRLQMDIRADSAQQRSSYVLVAASSSAEGLQAGNVTGL